VIHPSPDVLENVLHAKEFQISMFCDKTCMFLYILHLQTHFGAFCFVLKKCLLFHLHAKGRAYLVRVFAILSMRSHGFSTRPVFVRFVVDKLTLKQVPLRGIRFYPVIVISPMIQTHSLMEQQFDCAYKLCTLLSHFILMKGNMLECRRPQQMHSTSFHILGYSFKRKTNH
jgi:hypothetical protein